MPFVIYLDQSAGSHFRVKNGLPVDVRQSNPELQVMEILVNGLAETQAAQASEGFAAVKRFSFALNPH
jgi:hypothetical protein